MVADELAQLRRTQQESEGLNTLTPAQLQEIRDFQRDSDLLNNYGGDFWDPHLFSSSAELFRSEPAIGQTQSGGAYGCTHASLLWQYVRAQCEKVMSGYTPVSAEAHVSSLLPRVVSLLHVLTGDDGTELHAEKKPIKSPSSSDQIAVFGLKGGYWWSGFSCFTHAMSMGRMLRLQTTTIDPSFCLSQLEPNSKQQMQRTKQEEDTLEELRGMFEACKAPARVLLLETILASNGGRAYRAPFIQAVQTLCHKPKHRVFIVADETLTSVRSGYLLHAYSIPGYRPDFVFLGKHYGCGLLLMGRDLIQDGSSELRDAMMESTTNVQHVAVLAHLALCFAFLQRDRPHERCRQEGIRIKEKLEAICGPGTVRGVGYLLWVKKYALAHLPARTTCNQRLLPRLDQTAETIASLLKKAATMAPLVTGWGQAALEAARCCCCACCGQDTPTLQPCKGGCLRVFHADCLSQLRRRKEKGCPCQRQTIVSSLEVDSAEVKVLDLRKTSKPDSNSR